MAERRIAAAGAGRGPAATEIRELFHVAKEFSRKTKELWDSVTDTDEDDGQ
jgi:hypothetical protein